MKCSIWWHENTAKYFFQKDTSILSEVASHFGKTQQELIEELFKKIKLKKEMYAEIS